MRIPIRKPGKYARVTPDVHLTPAKLAQLKQELERLRELALPRAQADVKRLADTGDYSENAGYQTAKGKLRGLLAKERELQACITRAEIISQSKPNGRVCLGASVTLETGGQEIRYTILGSAESDPARGIISHRSPIATQLMGKKVGDAITIQSKQETKRYRIVAIA